jgi:hypothetical protein
MALFAHASKHASYENRTFESLMGRAKQAMDTTSALSLIQAAIESRLLNSAPPAVRII